jgi:hypothetical protein
LAAGLSRSRPRHGARERRQGVSLRWRGRLKYIFQHTAWGPQRGRDALFDLTRDPGEVYDLAKDAPQRRELRARLREEIEGRAPGLWIRFENSGSVPFRGTLRGDGLQRARVRSVDLSCACVHYQRPGEATFEVPAGQRFTLLLEEVRHPELGLALQLEGEVEPFTASFDLDAFTGLEAVTLAGSAWRRGPPPAEGRTGLTLWWQGRRDLGSVSPLEDPAVREQLRALGYL